MNHYKTKIGRPDALAQMAALGQKRMNTWCCTKHLLQIFKQTFGSNDNGSNRARRLLG